MAVVVNQGPFGAYTNGKTLTACQGNIQKLIDLLTPSSVAEPKLMDEPEVSLPDAEVCRLITPELKGILAASNTDA